MMKYKPLQFTLALLMIMTLMVSLMASSVSEGDGEILDPEAAIIYINGHECRSGEILVTYAEMQPTSADHRIGKALNSNLYLENVPSTMTTNDYMTQMLEKPGVVAVQPNYFYRAELEVDDPAALLPSPTQWYLDTINAYEAWDITMGSTGEGDKIKVAILDSGIDIDHEDLAGQFSYITSVVDSSGGEDDDGHGSHVAGIVAGIANNGTGIAGIAPEAELLIIDVFTNDNGDLGTDSATLVEAFSYVVAQDARVVNMSLGGYTNYDNALATTLENATNAGIVCVAAGGNRSTDSPHYPGDYEACIAVISTDSDDSRSSFSDYGDLKDIAAPGGSIYSTYYNGGYHTLSGTSMASPVVAGVAALVLSVNPDLSVDEVKNILYTTARDLGDPGKDDDYGWGIVNAEAAVNAALATLNGTLSDTLGWGGRPSDNIVVEVFADDDNAYANVLESTDTDVNGEFELTLAAGTYHIQLSTPRCLTTTYRDVVILGGESNILDASTNLVQLIAGDIDGNGMITSTDEGILMNTANFGHAVTDSGVNPLCDLNGDGVIDGEDLGILKDINHFYKVDMEIDYAPAQ